MSKPALPGRSKPLHPNRTRGQGGRAVAPALSIRSLAQVGNIEGFHACRVKPWRCLRGQLHGLHPIPMFTYRILPEPGIPDPLREFRESVPIERWFELGQSFDTRFVRSNCFEVMMVLSAFVMASRSL